MNCGRYCNTSGSVVDMSHQFLQSIFFFYLLQKKVQPLPGQELSQSDPEVAQTRHFECFIRWSGKIQ